MMNIDGRINPVKGLKNPPYVDKKELMLVIK
jgi:hypothetical protein